MSGPKKGRFVVNALDSKCLFAAGVLGDSLGTLADGVLGEFTGQQKSDSCLDFSAGDG